MLVFAYCGKFTVAYVKWRMTPLARRKPRKGKGYATMMNLYLGALNLMYIFLVQKAFEAHRVRVRPRNLCRGQNSRGGGEGGR